jgi:hypothetical protein
VGRLPVHPAGASIGMGMNSSTPVPETPSILQLHRSQLFTASVKKKVHLHNLPQ